MTRAVFKLTELDHCKQDCTTKDGKGLEISDLQSSLHIYRYAVVS